MYYPVILCFHVSYSHTSSTFLSIPFERSSSTATSMCTFYIPPSLHTFVYYIRLLSVLVSLRSPLFSLFSFPHLTCPDTTYHGLIFSTVSLAYIRIPSLDPSLFSSL